MSNLNNKKIKICILEMSSQNKAILEFFFDNSGKSLFEESSIDQAAAYIVDYDYPAAKENAEKIHDQYKIPGIIISIKEVDHADTVWIAKPLTIKALTSAKEQISLIISELMEDSKTSSQFDDSQNKLQIDKQKDVPEKNSISLDQASFNNDLEAQQIAKQEKAQSRQSHTRKEQAVNTPALASFDNEPLLDEDLIFETDANTNSANNNAKNVTNKITPEVIEEPTPDTDSEIDELLLDLNGSDVNAVFEDDISSNVDVIENETLEEFHLDSLPKNTDEVDLDETNTSLELGEDNHLALDLLDVVSKKDSNNQVNVNNAIEAQQIAKQEKVQSRQSHTHKEQAVNTPALAGFADEPLLVDDLIFEADTTSTNNASNNANNVTNKIIPEVIEEPTPNTDSEIDELLLDLSGSDINTVFEDDTSSNIEVIENDTLEEFSLEPLPKNTEEIVGLEEKNTSPEVDEDNHLALDPLDVVAKKDRKKQENSSIKIDEGGSSDIIADQNNSESLFLDSTPENALENDYFEPVHDDINTLPTDNEFGGEINSLSREVEEVKAESILEQVNDQLNNDLLKSDTFSVDNNTTHESSLSDLSLDKQIAELESVDVLGSEEVSIETINNDVATVEHSIEENTLLEPDNTNNTAQVTQSNEASVKAPSLDEKIVPEEVKASSDEIESELSAEEELQTLLEEIRQEAEGATLIRSNDGQGFTSQRHTPTFAEERWTKTCGESDPVGGKQIPYMPENHMQSSLQKVIAKAKSTQKVMRLKFNGTIIVVMPELQMIYCDVPIYDSAFADICYEPISQEDIKVHYLDSSEIRLYKKKVSEGSELAHSFESFLWTTSLLTSRGRLPHGTDIKKTVAIKYWPDLTRIETFPHIMQIAAVFYKHPGCLRDIPTWLGIEQRYIYAFYNGALSLGLMELDHKQLSLQVQKSGAFKKTKNRGFFSRLLKRINT